MTTPENPQPRPTPDVAPRTTADDAPVEANSVCSCGSTQWRDVSIRGGQWVRRECEGCSRFVEFPVWCAAGDGAQAENAKLLAAMEDPEVARDRKAADDQRKPQDQPWRDKNVSIEKRIERWNQHHNGIITAIRRTVAELVVFGPMAASQVDAIQADAKRVMSMIRACKAVQICGECGGDGCHTCRFSGMLSKRQAETADVSRRRRNPPVPPSEAQR